MEDSSANYAIELAQIVSGDQGDRSRGSVRHSGDYGNCSIVVVSTPICPERAMDVPRGSH